MITWTFRAGVAALCLLGLTGCEPGQGGFLGAAPNMALSEARMADGTVTLVPPRGFCIDRKSLGQRFALLARCDKLGAPSAAADAPLGIITVSISEAAAEQGLPSAPQTAAAFGLSNLSALSETTSRVIFRAVGEAPVDGMAPLHWRGTARLGDKIMGLALYGPENGRVLTGEGRRILDELIDGSGAGS